MSTELTSAAGIVALAAAVTAIVSLAVTIWLLLKLRGLRSAQKMLLGPHGERDLIVHSQQMQEGFVALREFVESTFGQIEQRMAGHAGRLDRSISHTAVVRYDAWGEMSGRQSSSMALLDDQGSGVVMSSILHREQARMYVKDIVGGESQYELSPEEKQAIAAALDPSTRQQPVVESQAAASGS